MVPAGKKCIRVFLAAAWLSNASAQMMKGFMNSLVDDTKPATMQELVAEGGGLKTENCGSLDDAMTVERINVRPDSLMVTVNGIMARQLTGGTVHVKLSIEKPDNLSVAQRFKYAAASSIAKGKSFSQPLCQHLGAAGDAESCVIPVGKQELRFAFPSLPQMLLAGKYTLELRAVDDASKPVTCVRGALNVQPGKSKGLLRTLTECSIDHWKNDFVSATINDQCDRDQYISLDFEMKPDLAFSMQGYWSGYCENEQAILHVSKNYNAMYTECNPSDSDPCGHVGCASVQCEYEYDGAQVPTCNPTGDCGSTEMFSVFPSQLEEMIQKGDLSELEGMCYQYEQYGSPISFGGRPAATLLPALVAAAAFFVPFLQG